jgi:hypothetical protein
MAVATLLAATALTGCSVVDMIAGGQQESPTASPSRSPSASGDASAGGITFEAGADLDPSWGAQWGDPFIGSADFTVYSPDDGKGSWSYQENATGCIIGYWQGAVDGLDASAGDSALSDKLLAIQFDAEVSDVASYAGDTVSFSSFAGPIAARSVAGADKESGQTYIVAARAFGALGAGLVATLDCPEGLDVYAQWQTLAADPGAFTAVVGNLG